MWSRTDLDGVWRTLIGPTPVMGTVRLVPGTVQTDPQTGLGLVSHVAKPSWGLFKLVPGTVSEWFYDWS